MASEKIEEKNSKQQNIHKSLVILSPIFVISTWHYFPILQKDKLNSSATITYKINLRHFHANF